MKKLKQCILSSLFATFLSTTLYAQINKIDSIRIILRKVTNDTTANKAYLDIGMEFEKYNVDSSLVYYKLALKNAKESKFLFGKANANIFL